MVTCPVCGMQLDQEDAVDQMEYQGNTYFFCCDECAEQFEESPNRFAMQQSF